MSVAEVTKAGNRRKTVIRNLKKEKLVTDGFESESPTDFFFISFNKSSIENIFLNYVIERLQHSIA